MKLILTVGLPRSGKSTWAKTTGWPIVNPDSIRLALHGQRFYGPAEPMVWAFAHLMVESLRLAGHAVIVLDATNTQAKRREEWERQYPGAVEFRVIRTTKEECLRRAHDEGDSVIVPVIERMTAQWDFPEWHEGVRFHPGKGQAFTDPDLPAPSPVEEPARGPGRIDVADGFGFCAGLPVEDPRAKAERIIAHVKAHGGDMTTWRVEELLREAVRLLKSAPVESSTDGKGRANG